MTLDEWVFHAKTIIGIASLLALALSVCVLPFAIVHYVQRRKKS